MGTLDNIKVLFQDVVHGESAQKRPSDKPALAKVRYNKRTVSFPLGSDTDGTGIGGDARRKKIDQYVDSN